MITRKLLDYTQEKVARLFVGFLDESHGLGHIGRTVSYGRKICDRERRKSGLVEMAAWLHDIGRVEERANNAAGLSHHILSEKLARKWFQDDWRFSVLFAKEKEEILYAVKNHGFDAAVDYQSAVILRDADKLDLYGVEGLERHQVFHANDIHELNCNLMISLERVSRLKTAAAQEILRERKLSRPLEDYLKKVRSGKAVLGKKILCAISGGVDSAVAAALLKKAGYDVTGAFMKCYNGTVPGLAAPCWIEDRREALRVAAKLGIKLLTFDFEKEYRRDVIDYLYKEYRAGRTPNPDVMCNKQVKIPLLLKAAGKLEFDYIVTGHYARLRRDGNVVTEQLSGQSPSRQSSTKLLQAVDSNKDQTYFLHQLGQKELSRLIFPVGTLCKDEIRIFAKQWGLPVADREESMGICFVGEMPMKEFLQKRIKPRRGPIVLSSGKKVGKHEGLAFYTIGEKISCHFEMRPKNHQSNNERFFADAQNDNMRPLFVLAKDIKRNRLIIGYENNLLLYKKKIQVRGVNWLAGQPPEFPLKCEMRLRHRQPLQKAIIKCTGKKVVVNFEAPQRAVTPGQFAVFYKENECLGGGIIK